MKAMCGWRGQGERDSPDDGERTNNRSNLPGKEPGKEKRNRHLFRNFNRERRPTSKACSVRATVAAWS